MNKMNRDISNIIRIYLLPSRQLINNNKDIVLQMIKHFTGTIKEQLDNHKFYPHCNMYTYFIGNMSKQRYWILNNRKLND